MRENTQGCVTRRHYVSSLLGASLLAFGGRGRTQATTSVSDELWADPLRKRDVPIKLRWPDDALHQGERAVVLFSHGLGGTREGGALWGEAWAQVGFVVVHLQHPGSDFAAVRSVATSLSDRSGLRNAASPAQLVARLGDVGFALDEITRLHKAQHGRWSSVRPTRVGMSGHSFGAHTTLGMAGQRYPGFDGIAEPRLASFIAFSPTLPPSGDPQRAFERLTRPVLSITGTRDQDVLGTGATPENRARVFAALPKGDKGHLVLQDADHMTFAGQTGQPTEIVPREQITRDLQPAHHTLVASVTTDWWRATLLDDTTARARLATPVGLRSGDVWQTA